MVIRSLARTDGLPADVLVSYAALVAADVTDPAEGPPYTATPSIVAKDAGRSALLTFLTALDQWVKDVRASREARGVLVDPGDEFVMYPSDVRRIIADVAREIGVEL
jgi:hypothetical protein